MLPGVTTSSISTAAVDDLVITDNTSPSMATSGVKARRRSGAFNMELPIRGDIDENTSPTGKNRFRILYLPAVLAQLGLVEFVVGFLYSHWWGAFVGALALAGGLGLLWKQPQRLQSGWASSLTSILLVYVSLLVLVRLASFHGWQDVAPNLTNPADFFPEKCPPGKLLGCTRVAVSESHPDPKATPAKLNVYIQDAVSAVEKWAAQEPRTRILVKRQEPMDSILTAGKSKCTVYMHIRALTLFMGFVDDVFVNLECFKEKSTDNTLSSTGFVLVSAQSQLRLGKGDLGVNGQRVKRLYASVESSLAAVEKGDCTKRLGTMAT